MTIMRRMLRAIGKDRETSWGFTITLGLLYAAYLVWMHIHHEMWRDELHPWTMARLAHGFWDLVTGDRIYDGHPPLWFWYLRVWTWFVQGAWGIQAATATAALAAAVLFVRFAPFPRFLKVVALFSFYFAYEYTVMARNYVLALLCTCLFSALYHPLRVRHLALGAAVALVSVTSAYGLIMSPFLLAFVILDQVGIGYVRGGATPPARITLSCSPRLLATAGVASVGILFCVLTIDPPDPNPFTPAFTWGSLGLSALPEMLYRVAGAFLPWRSLAMGRFWGTHTFWEPGELGASIAGAVLFVLALISLIPSWRLVLVFFGGVAAMDIFSTVRFSGAERHWGHIVLLFIAACWILRTTFPNRKHWISTVVLFAMFAFQTEAAVVAMILDTKETFSGGRDAAAFIVREGLQDLPIVAGPDYVALTVTGYLRRNFVAHETEETNQTVVFHSRHKGFSPAELVNRSVALARERKGPVLLITNQGIPDPPAGTTRTRLYGSPPVMVGDEHFTVYRVEAK
jgi:hypothetical protein